MSVANTKLIHLVANPKSGKGKALDSARWAERHLTSRGVNTQLHWTDCRGHAIAIVSGLEYSRDAAVCAVGGDGTMNEVVNGNMMRSKDERFPLALLPAGTGNALGSDLDLLNPQKVLEGFLNPSRRWVDLLRVKTADATMYAINVIGWGMFATANRRAEALRRFGALRYHLAGLCEIFGSSSFEGRLEFESTVLTGSFALVAATNTRYAGKAMLISPHARLDDGMLDLVFLRPVKKVDLLRLFMRLRTGGHIRDARVKYLQTKGFHLSSENAFQFNVDGEQLESDAIEVGVMPSVLEFVSPASNP